MKPTDKIKKRYVVPLGSPARDYDIAIEAFHFLDRYTIWQKDIQEHVLNSPEEVEIALRKLLKEVSDGSD